MVDYIDDYIGIALPSVASASFYCLHQLMTHLGLSISEKKLVAPSTRVTCLGVLIDTENTTVSIPSEKLAQILENVRYWSKKRI